MKQNSIPKAYIGREQAYVKHQILRTYLQRLFLIIGQKSESVINYIDCFSGPWQAGDEKLSDTSIGVSLAQMDVCRAELEKLTGRKIQFRALYIEKDEAAFKKLETFINSSPYPEIEVECRKGDYVDIMPEIVSWCSGYFSFFFVDPKGWQKVVGGQTMKPLLELEKAEFLINLMYEFINRFVSLGHHAVDMIELFGEVPEFINETPEERKQKLQDLYRSNINKYYKGRSAYVTIEKPGRDRALYFLVYLTRHPKGLEVFKDEAEKMNMVQRITQLEVKLRSRSEKSGTMDLFADQVENESQQLKYLDNRLAAKKFLLERLSELPLLIDMSCWADFLEQTDLYPSDFQAAMGELVRDGVVENVDADISRRRSRFIKPDWPNRSERWKLKS